ncbi:MAG TPA: hypothetical protein VGE15_08985 [Sphingobacteriaceae bacterium]
MRAFYTFLFLFAICPVFLKAQPGAATPVQLSINNFIVKEHLLKNEKIAIIACDADEKPMEHVNGVFQFSLNGFKQELKFNEGVAIAPQPINESTFMYLRHKNEAGTHGKLYYILKQENNLKPIKINWMMLAVIPVAIILIAFTFRKLLIWAVVVLLVLFFFNARNGLNLPTFFDTIFDGLKSVF